VSRILSVIIAIVAVGGVLLIIPSAASAAPNDISIQACSGSACDGKDPAAFCGGDARTVQSLRLGGVALLELRYSGSCRATWARISNAPWVDHDTFPSAALIHRNSDGREYSCTVPLGATSCYTPMVNDANVTSYAYGAWDGGAQIFTGQTASF
jgi:hypothetical protein